LGGRHRYFFYGLTVAFSGGFTKRKQGKYNPLTKKRGKIEIFWKRGQGVSYQNEIF
jgi:hypothetical protein